MNNHRKQAVDDDGENNVNRELLERFPDLDVRGFLSLCYAESGQEIPEDPAQNAEFACIAPRSLMRTDPKGWKKYFGDITGP